MLFCFKLKNFLVFLFIIYILTCLTHGLPMHENMDSKSSEETKPENLTKPVNHAKDLVFCEINNSPTSIQSTCDLTAFNFTFYAYFKPKRDLKFKTVRELASTLSNHSTCEVRYMKVISVLFVVIIMS
jgi:hypothetical protein